MVLPKGTTRANIGEWLVFLYLAIFPLGQIIRLKVNLIGYTFPLHPVDLIALLILALLILGKVKQPTVVKYFLTFIAAAVFSTLSASFFLTLREMLTGVFYLLRITAYISFIPVIWSIYNNKSKKELLFNSLIAVCVITAVLGWIQYLWLPDLRDLKYIGWDDHYFRLFGTFLDPAFMGIILVFGSLIALS